MKWVASNLETFSVDLIEYGQGIVDAVMTLPGYQDYLGTVEQLNKEDIEKLPSLEIGSEGKNDSPR